jgi:hypothetical protein
MDKLKGTGSTFSTSGKPWAPFKLNRQIAAKHAKGWRLKRKGFGLPPDKASLRAIADQVGKPKP